MPLRAPARPDYAGPALPGRPLYAGPRPKWKLRGDYRYYIALALCALFIFFGQADSARQDTARHDPSAAHMHEIGAYIWLIIFVGWSLKAYQTYRRRP